MSRRRAGGERSSAVERVVNDLREAEAVFEEELAHDKAGLAAAGTAPPTPPAGEEADIWYYAFGSNINKKVFEGRRMIKPAESSPAVLPGYRLCFNMPGMPYREPGFGSVEPIPAASAGAGQNGSHGGGGSSAANGVGAARAPASSPWEEQEVHGVAHRVTPTEWAYILETEGAAVRGSEYGYGVVDVEVVCYDGRRLPAFTLMAQPKTVAQLQGNVPLPSLRYLSLIREGAKEYELDPAYCSYLDGLQHYEAKGLRKRFAGLVMAAIAFSLLLPVFVPLRLYRRVMGLKTAGAGKGPGVQGQARALYFRAVFSLLWWLHRWMQPVLGSGCS